MKKLLITLITIGTITNTYAENSQYIKREFDKKMCKVIYDNITNCLLQDDKYKRHTRLYESTNKDLVLTSYAGKICNLIYQIGVAERSKEPIRVSGLDKELDPIIKDYLVDYCGYNQQDIEDKIKREWNIMYQEMEKEKKEDSKWTGKNLLS